MQRSSWWLHIWRNDPDHAEVPIPQQLQEDDFYWRSLRSLVCAVPDSFVLVRRGDVLTYKPEHFDDVPWYNDVAALVVQHFHHVLLTKMPDGEWHLGVTGE